jgi:carotenoid cleavage dioxygenase
MPARRSSPFLRENFAPVVDEVDALDLVVEGELPPDLHGTYVRNGPNPRFPDDTGYHWFEGDGMLHSVRLDGSSASYRNRFVRTAALREEEEAGHALWHSGFRPDGAEMIKNAANTAVIALAGRAFALLEGGVPYEFEPETLATIGPFDFDGRLQGTFTAHPKLDPCGELVYFGWHPFRTRVDHGVVDADGAIVHTTSFDLPATTMMHDFAITESWSVFFDHPLKYRVEKIADGGIPISWEPEAGTRVGVLARFADGGEIRWYDLPAFYFFHVGNAYEENASTLVFTAARQARTTFAGAATIESVSADAYKSPRLHEWRLDLETGRCTEQPLDEIGSEFPRIAPSVVGRANRYTYGAHEAAPTGIRSATYTGAFKLDHHTGELAEHSWGAGCFGGENVFVPRPAGSAEDDGWLLGFVYDEQADSSQLRVLDARCLEAGEVARVVLPRRVPYGFHGEWFPTHGT